MGKFGISQPVKRREDVRLLTGQGSFVEDAARPGMAHGCMLRSPHAHARITRLDAAAAMAAHGVLAVLTGADIEAEGVRTIPTAHTFPAKAGTEIVEHGYPTLAHEVARYAGDGVAFVVAETYAEASDAAEMIAVDFEPLAVAVGCGGAAQAGAPLVWPDVPNNLAFQWETGDAAATEAAFARAAHVIALDVVNNRIVQNPMETRNALAEWDPGAGKLTLTTGTQMPHLVRDQLLAVLGLEPPSVRVVVGDVGGGFGGKNGLYPEQVLVALAARRLGRPVIWSGQRGEAFLSEAHARDNVTHGELAFDDAGRILGFRVKTLADLGAYVTTRGTGSPIIGTIMASNTYRVPVLHVEVHGVYSNTVPTDVYRGAGRPEITYLFERLIDAAAHDLAIDRTELRRRNLIPADAFPYASPTGITYDSCDFEGIMDAAMAETDWKNFEERRAEAAARGKLRGIGMANFVERCGGGGGLQETARLAFDEDGGVTLFSGSMANGQGHETAFSQIVNERLGLPFEKIRIVQGDTDAVPSGEGTGGSWSIPMGGGAVCHAADLIVDKARRITGHVLEAAEADLVFADGAFSVVGTDLKVSISDVARASFDATRLPPGTEPGLDEEASFKPDNFTFPHGCHVCEVEVDAETGAVEVIAYSAVHDFGRALNPDLLAGQVHGGVVQGIGQALMEHTVFDDVGQLTSGSFMDYRMPRADDLPDFTFLHRDTPTTRNPLGIKGCGEAGAAGAPPAVINAVVDALAPLGVRHVDMPATSGRLWEILREKKA
ncbi:MAG TPA: xanthine dehydrogenase family protein molybdopterin-binding subunit [Rhodospirillales bacterium]|nr:xanthine dehydrogenase family protein molybdopterin-binding subunit [Rhodospirillales bacterium]